MPALQINPRFAARTVGESIYHSLRQEILALRLKPGDPLNIKDVAEMYGVSRSPVRDALMHLNSDGLVDVFPQRGCQVSLIDRDRVRQEFFLREALELLAVTQAVPRMTPADLLSMERCIALQQQDLLEENMEQYLRHDNDFHDVFFETLGQERAKQLLHSQCVHYRRVRMLSFRHQNVTANVLEEHLAILEAIRQGDAELVKKLEIAHLHRMDSQIDSMHTIEPSYFNT